MISYIRSKWLELKEYFRDEISEMGGIHIFVIATIIFLIALPFLLLYYCLLEPAYKSVRMLIEAKELGLKESYRKQFHADEYEREKRDKKRKAEKAKPLITDGIYKRFQDIKNWPDAYAVDDIAIYGAEGRVLLFVSENAKEFVVPEGVVNVYHRCFANCHSLKAVKLPSSIKRIGKKAFKNCISLEDISIPESVTFIGEELFMNCSSLKRATLPSRITEIPTRMFCNCKSLVEIELPEQTKIIETEAFRRCYALEHISLNEQLEIAKKNAFEDCRSLKEFIMPESVKRVSVGEFNGCNALQHIHFSSQVNDFGGSCCHDCWSIKEITMTPFNEEDLDYFRNKWEEYADEVDISKSENPYPKSRFWTMDDALYFGVPRLTNVCLVFCYTKREEYTIPSFVTNIKREAFSSCRNLRTLRLSPFIKAGDDPWGTSDITYGFIYEYWPQVTDIKFDMTLKNTKYAFGLIG